METSRSPASGKAQRRCPSCRSRVGLQESACPICGHVFAPDPAGLPPDEPRPERVEITDTPLRKVMARSTGSAASPGRRSFLSQLPWGVMGVVAVIAALVIGAALLLRDMDSSGGATPMPTPAGTSLAAGMATEPASPPAAGATITFADTPTVAAATDTPTPEPPTPLPPTDTPAPPPDIEYEVQAGDTCGGIAMKYNVPVDTLIAYNNLDANCFLRIGDKLRIPQPTPTPGPAPTLPPGATLPDTATPGPLQPTEAPLPTATLPPQIVYTVREGDTCGEIAARFRMSVSQLIQQNGLDDNCLIRIGQTLTLTFATPTPAVSPTPIIAQTPTPRVGYPAPQLVSPVEDALITESVESVTLAWLSVGLLKENEWYVVQVQPAGAITVPVFETKATSIRLTRAIFDGYDERSFAWWVQVKQLVAVDPRTNARVYNDLSPASAVRRFTWRRPAGTPTPMPNGG